MTKAGKREYTEVWLDSPEKLVPYVYQPMPNPSEEKFEALKDDIRQRGIEDPIWVDKDYAIIDGHQRTRVWIELRKEGHDIGPVPVRVYESDEDTAYRDALRRNMLRRGDDLSSEDIDDMILRHIKHTQQWYAKHGYFGELGDKTKVDWRTYGVVSDANNRVARFFGVGSKRVRQVRARAEESGELEPAAVLVGGPDDQMFARVREDAVAHAKEQFHRVDKVHNRIDDANHDQIELSDGTKLGLPDVERIVDFYRNDVGEKVEEVRAKRAAASDETFDADEHEENGGASGATSAPMTAPVRRDADVQVESDVDKEREAKVFEVITKLSVNLREMPSDPRKVARSIADKPLQVAASLHQFHGLPEFMRIFYDEIVAIAQETKERNEREHAEA